MYVEAFIGNAANDWRYAGKRLYGLAYLDEELNSQERRVRHFYVYQFAVTLAVAKL